MPSKLGCRRGRPPHIPDKGSHPAGNIVVRKGLLCLPRRPSCEQSSLLYSRSQQCPSLLPSPMLARGARTTGVAFQTARILPTSNAGPRLAVWPHIAHRIHFPGRPTARPQEAGMLPPRLGVIGVTNRAQFVDARCVRSVQPPGTGVGMRAIILILIALIAISCSSTPAQAGAWCATYRWGGVNCGYSTSDQCWATVRGIGGFCRPNPFPGTAYGTSSGSWNSPTPSKRYQRAY